MESGALLSAIATCACTALAAFVACRRERSGVASTMLALLLALALWNGGLAVAALTDAPAWNAAARRTAMLGAIAASGLWLLLALRHRAPRRVRGPAATVVAMAPAFVYFVAALTNTSHGWLFRPGTTVIGGSSPFAHALAFVAGALGFSGTVLFVLAALRLWREREPRSAVALGLAVVAQPVATLAAASGALQGTMPLAAATLALVTLVLALTALRYQVLEPPPLGHRQVIEQLRHGVLMASAAGEILDHNAAARRLLGRRARGGSIAETIALLAPDEQRAEVRQVLLRVETALEPVTLQLQTAHDRHLEVLVRPILSDDRGVIGQVATLRDRTQEIRYAETALRSERRETLGTLAAGVAHEVNNPLAFAHANLCEIARMGARVDVASREGSKLAEELAELGELAGDALDGLDRIRSAVADVHRLAAAPEVEAETVSLNAALSDAVRLALPRAGGRVSVASRLAPDLPLVQGSPQLLVQAFVSLLMNSQQALEAVEDPRIELETGGGEQMLWVRVSDNGPGVPEELRERIFEPFFTTGVASGARGLGLSVAAGIARDHGGSLRVEASERGASFLFRIAAREMSR